MADEEQNSIFDDQNSESEVGEEEVKGTFRRKQGLFQESEVENYPEEGCDIEINDDINEEELLKLEDDELNDFSNFINSPLNNAPKAQVERDDEVVDLFIQPDQLTASSILNYIAQNQGSEEENDGLFE
eukprot:GCRY01003499.1.p3 GENE.GCRY01003499.1~~GCRY01003499.1.p3  ORF type:complete len:129 (+),score=29.66 GCRY01003499.1:104-490(+)